MEQKWLDASLSTEPWDWSISTIPDITPSPELGTIANPIVIDDDTLPLGSPSNPIVIYDEEGGHQTEQTGSDADTEPMLTPEFWDSVMNFDPPHRATVVDLTQDSLSVGSSGSQNTAQVQLLCDMPTICNQMSDDSSKAIEADERSVRSSDNNSPRAAEAAECKSRRKEISRDKGTGTWSTNEISKMSTTCLQTPVKTNAVTPEPAVAANKIPDGKPSDGASTVNSTKRKRVQEKVVSFERRRTLRSSKGARR